MIACFDHEEIGSETYVGANCEYLRDVIERITSGLGIQNREDHSRILRRSFLLSCDMAHSVHPCFSSFY
jgi:aspartyl aminopeptidase